MKKKIVSLTLAAIVAMSAPVFAAPSVGQIVPEAPAVVGDVLEANTKLVVINADVDKYENKVVADAVKDANDDKTVTTLVDTLKALNVDVENTEFKTVDGLTVVDPAAYDYLTVFVDLALDTLGNISYELKMTEDADNDGLIKASMIWEAAKDQKKEDLLLVQVDPKTAEPAFITVDELDEKTGEITAKFPTLGPVALLKLK